MTFCTEVQGTLEMERDQTACTLESMCLWGSLAIDMKGGKARARSDSHITQLLNL